VVPTRDPRRERESLGELEKQHMHPAFYFWHRHAHRGQGGHGCGPHDAFFGGHHGHGGHGPGGHDDGPFGGGGFFGGGGPFGVRRPLRFIAHKLDLSEAQVAELARILDELKTERAQADVDNRRTVAALAEAVEGATFNEARAKEGGDQRVKSAEHLRDAVVKALSQIHAVLDDDQRKQLAYLIRTGVLQV
jgi:Spy/CpxP family protein refolding chaperone